MTRIADRYAACVCKICNLNASHLYLSHTGTRRNRQRITAECVTRAHVYVCVCVCVRACVRVCALANVRACVCVRANARVQVFHYKYHLIVVR